MRSAGLLLGLGAAASAWVVPNQQIFAELQPGAQPKAPKKWNCHGAWLEELKAGLGSAIEGLEEGWSRSNDFVHEMGTSATSSADKMIDDLMEGLPETADLSATVNDFVEEELPEIAHPPHKSDKTIYELVSESEYTTKFAKLLDDNEEFRDLLNKTDANITVFVPTDKAFEKIPDHGKKPPKKFIEALLKHHVLPDVYPSGKIFGVHTLPTLLEGKNLSSEPTKTPQRLSVKLGWRGLYLNGYNRVTYRDIFASNGVIHGVSTFNIPPAPLAAVVTFVPTAFSQFELGVWKSGLAGVGRLPHLGATVFAPENGAWKKLGFKVNAFLFSRFGRKYLKALLSYHVVANQTLYSDKFYGPGAGDGDDEDATAIPKGRIHLDLPTLLKGKSVGVDVGRYGRLIDVHVNYYSKVIFQDAIGRDGVIHVIDRILIPPRNKHDHGDDAAAAEQDDYDGGEISVEELRARLEPYVEAESEHEHEHEYGHPAPFDPHATWELENMEL